MHQTAARHLPLRRPRAAGRGHSSHRNPPQRGASRRIPSHRSGMTIGILSLTLCGCFAGWLWQRRTPASHRATTAHATAQATAHATADAADAQRATSRFAVVGGGTKTRLFVLGDDGQSPRDLEFDRGEPEYSTIHCPPVLSPRGDQLLLLATELAPREGGNALLQDYLEEYGRSLTACRMQLINTDGSDSKTLMTMPGSWRKAGFSRDGAFMCAIWNFAGNGYLALLSGGGAQFSGLVCNGRMLQDFAFSPDGRTLIVAAQDRARTRGHQLLQIDTRQARRRPNRPLRATSFLPHVAARRLALAFDIDGRSIVYLKNSKRQSEICRVTLADKRTRHISWLPKNALSYAFSADGRAIAYVTGDDRATFRIFYKPIAARKARQVWPAPVAATWPAPAAATWPAPRSPAPRSGPAKVYYDKLCFHDGDRELAFLEGSEAGDKLCSVRLNGTDAASGSAKRDLLIGATADALNLYFLTATS